MIASGDDLTAMSRRPRRLAQDPNALERVSMGGFSRYRWPAHPGNGVRVVRVLTRRQALSAAAAGIAAAVFAPLTTAQGGAVARVSELDSDLALLHGLGANVVALRTSEG